MDVNAAIQHEYKNKSARRGAQFEPIGMTWKCLYQVRAIAVFPVFPLLNDFFCLLTNDFCLSL
jgi:hypothetical protein